MNNSSNLTKPVEAAAEPVAVDPNPVSRWVYVERGFSLAAIVGVILLGGSAILGMQNLFSENEAVATTENIKTRQTGLPSPQSVLDAVNRPGHWQMAGWQWELGVIKVHEQEVDQYLENVPPAVDMFSLEEEEVAARLIEAMEFLPFEKFDRGRDTLYRLDDKQLKLRVVTSLVDGTALPVSIAAAARVSDQEWTVFEMREKQQASSLAGQGIDQDIAQCISRLSTDNKTLCSRTDQQGRSLFEIIQTDTTISVLVDELKNKGWEVRNAPSVNQPRLRFNQAYLCANQDDLIHVWNVNSDSTNGNQIALMRVTNQEN